LRINTDKNDAYPPAIRELKQQGKLAPDVEHRQVKYLNNRLEADHGGLKRLNELPRSKLRGIKKV
jgi:transposase, IS6 family